MTNPSSFSAQKPSGTEEQRRALVAAAERLGLGPQPALARNPRLVYGRITGWGQDGPWAQRAGHDITYIAVAGVLAHDRGTVDVFGVRIDSERAAERVKGRLGFMPQGLGLNLYPELSVEENVDFFARLRLVPKDELAERKQGDLKRGGNWRAERARALGIDPDDDHAAFKAVKDVNRLHLIVAGGLGPVAAVCHGWNDSSQPVHGRYEI